jgi:hypothetical protein
MLRHSPEGPVVRSVLAFVLGCAGMTALSAMANAVIFHGGAGGQMPAVLAALLLVMRGLAAIAGGYTAAAIARRRPASHGLAAGVLYVLASQLAPATMGRLSGAPAAQSLGMAAAAIAVTLLGATLGGSARGQVFRGKAPTDA